MCHATTKILIVEDNALIAGDLEATVEGMGYCVIGPALTLGKGLDYARHADIDFALLDYDLGNGTNSSPIAEMLTARGLPFTFVTGSDPAIMKAAFGPAAVLAKPVDDEALERILPG